jgi:hypothetical protein
MKMLLTLYLKMDRKRKYLQINLLALQRTLLMPDANRQSFGESSTRLEIREFVICQKRNK